MRSKQLLIFATKRDDKYFHPSVSLSSREVGKLSKENIRIRMIYAGLCGTDIHMTQTDPNGMMKSSAPCLIPNDGRILGHEGIGIVQDPGLFGDQFSIGDYIVFESILTCKQCSACQRGDFNQCENAVLLGTQMDGVYQEIADLPASLCYVIGKHLDDALLQSYACVEPASVAWLACEQSSNMAGSSVLIFGGGPIGQFIAMLAKDIFGALEVNLVEPSEFRRNLAQNYCDHVYDVQEFFALKNKGFDIVFEASGVLNNITRIIQSIKANGWIILLARSGEHLSLNAIDHIITNAITIRGVRGHLGGAFNHVIDLVCSKQLELNSIVTDVLPSLEELEKLLQSDDPIENSHCKILAKI